MPARTERKAKEGQYSRTEKVSAVRMLIENGYNYKKTSVQTGISRGSLQAWVKLYEKELTESTSVQSIAKSVEVNIARAKTEYINKHFNSMSRLAEEAIKKAIELVQEEDDLSKVNDTIRTRSNVIVKIGGEEGAAERAGDTYNLIQQTIVACNRMQGDGEVIELKE